jgi:hypothetical protein
MAEAYRSSTRIRHGEYRVIPQLIGGSGAEVYLVVSPTGVPLYTFDDMRDAAAEAAVLNRGKLAAEPAQPAWRD